MKITSLHFSDNLLSKLALALLIPLSVFSAKAESDSLTMGDFMYSLPLVVDGYTESEPLTNFPVLVRISESGISGFRYADMSAINPSNGKTTGKDLAFFAKDGTRLASENDTWVDSGESLAWVQIPEMTNGTEFVMCYNVPDGVYVTNANPWVEYVGVWHLKEEGGKSKAVIQNSTTNNLPLGITSSKGSPAVFSAGKIGAARRIATDTSNNPGYDSGITIAITNETESAALAAVNSLAPEFTASFWYYPEADASNWEYLMSRKNADGYSAWGIQFGDERTAVWGQLRIYGSNGGAYAIGDGLTYGSGTDKGVSIPDGAKNQWRKLDCVWTSDKKFNLYIDGSLVAAGALSGNKAAENGKMNLSIGGALAPASGKGGRGFKGVMDEARLRKGITSAAWVKADYDTVTNSSFVVASIPDDLTINWVGGFGATPGFKGATPGTEVATFAGTVMSLGTATSCDIEYKLWEKGVESEPAGWSTLTNDLAAADIFSVDIPDLLDSRAYQYKLRAVGDNATETEIVAGEFTPVWLAATWAKASGRSGVTNIFSHVVFIGGSVVDLGGSATCNIEGKFWTGDAEPDGWITIGDALSATGNFAVTVTDLLALTTYNYKLRLKGSNGSETRPVAGTFETGDGLALQWAGDAETLGIANLAWNAVDVGGTLQSLGTNLSCTVKAKFWTGELAEEPGAWETLGDEITTAGDFERTVAGLLEATDYNYRLLVTNGDGTESVTVAGAFKTPVGLAVEWAGDAGTPGVTNTLPYSAAVGGTLTCMGSADSCTIKGKFWLTGETMPEEWTAISEALSEVGDFSVTVSGLTPDSTYRYSLCVVGNNGFATEPVNGTFDTSEGVLIAWDRSVATGISRVEDVCAVFSGNVKGLGDASSCGIQVKVWPADEAEPDGGWRVLAENMLLHHSFIGTVAGLEADTTYCYKLKGVGNNGSETDLVAGTFTTLDDPDAVLGSAHTHFFEDADNSENSCWVANDFERFLKFKVTGYTGTEVLKNFPVLVDVRDTDSSIGFSYSDFYHYDGKDIAFVDEKGHIIPHEIDTWNKSGMSLFWVRLPKMTNGTEFTMCYRCPLVEPLPVVGNTFDKYVGVWHMNELRDGVVDLKDSTTNNLTAETHAQSLAGINKGQAVGGNARQVAQQPGSSSSYGRIIAFDNKKDILRTGVGNIFTFSAWYQLLTTTPKWGYLVARKSEDVNDGWGIQFNNNESGVLRVWTRPTSKTDYQTFAITNYADGSSTGYGHKKWTHWTFAFSNQTLRAYHNGRLVRSTKDGLDLSHLVANDETAFFDHLCIGGQQNGTGAFHGYVDEARYSKGLRSADWIKAEYDSNLQKDTPFVTKGAQVSRGVESLVPVVVWEKGDGLPDTILDVSYAYVQFAGTVTFCGAGATECRIEYMLWPDGEVAPTEWTILRSGIVAGTAFSIPVTGLKQDMLYNFRIRAANVVEGVEYQNYEHAGQFRTNGNVTLEDVEGELMRVGDKFVHRYRAGNWNFTTPDYVTNVEIMVVGGGGAGGYKLGGGGGGGGLYYETNFSVEPSTAYKIHVGEGGWAPTNLETESFKGNGQISYFALASDEANPLIMVPGGGGGGSYTNDSEIATGADGASGGGGTYAFEGGMFVSNQIETVWTTFGHKGGNGNDAMQGGAIGKTAAGGGGGAGRDGLSATFDTWSAGGAGGVGVGNSMTGELLFYGAGGGGGYAYREVAATGGSDFTKPGGGGSGIGGNAADVKNGTPATSGVENTGAGGGGGSMDWSNTSDSTYWQGGDGGDGVVLICYEAHGRDPIAEEPRITMSRCDYSAEKGFADINYRAYWAGIQAQTNDVYVLYSTVSYEDVVNGGGEMVKLVSDTIGIGVSTFTPPSVGYTYWVRLVAKKDANSYMYSDEIASFEVAAVEVNGTTPKMDDNDSSKDYAEISYNLYDNEADARLYCYWSENRSDLEGSTVPSGSTVHFLDLGTGKQANPGKFRIEAEDGLERNHSYYVRLATGNESGTRYFLSKQIVLLEMIDKPRVIFDQASWTNQNYSATVHFLLTTATLDPDTVDLYAIYSGDTNQVMTTASGTIDPAKYNLLTNSDVTVVNLGKCSMYPDDLTTVAQFPMWSPVDTNYYARLVLVTNDYPVCYSQRYQTITTIKAVPANTLLIYAYANPKIGCYGDEPQELDYVLSYGGLMEGPGWDNWTNLFSGTLSGSLSCAVTNSLTPSGQYEISNELGNLGLGSAGATYRYRDEYTDPDTGEYVSPIFYYYLLCTVTAHYTVTNAQFTASIADTNMVYTGEAIDIGALDFTFTGLRNEQPVSYEFRVGTNDWASTLPTTYSNIWTQVIQYRASAPSHDASTGTFKIMIDPAPLSADISAANMNYLGYAQTPTITTNVYGLVHGEINPLTCEFRDEVGEWSSELPQFTNPGDYKLFFRVSAPNHTTYVTNCTFTIPEWDYWVNMDGKEGFAVPINVSAPSWLLETTGETAAHFADNTDNQRYKNLDRVCTNGLKLWQNYVIDRRELDKPLVSAIRQRGSRVDDNSFVMYFPNVEALRNTGLKVLYRTEKKLRDESDFSLLAEDDHYEMNIPLGPGDPTGLYRFSMVLTPTNNVETGEAMYGGGESVLASASTVGVIRVSSVLTNIVTAVPWKSMTLGTAEALDVTAADVVNPNGIAVGDRILYFDNASGNFSEWSHTNATWDAITTVSELGVSEAPADTTRLASSNAFWLVRGEPGAVGATNYVYLVGRYTGEGYEFPLAGGTLDSPGCTLVANPTMYDVGLNDLVFVDGVGNAATPHAGDCIVVMDIAGVNNTYYRDTANTTWGREVVTIVKGRRKKSFETDVTIPSGTGFWYYRKAASALKIKFDSADADPRSE
ncbi:MAG: hypothetical protein J6U17_01355 [Kiritimatiellae bacterium]|nr:hypothetical protein [Kiritimatiellia bacterium]